MTMSQEEWDRRQAAGDWAQLPPHQPAPQTRAAHPWVDEALAPGSDPTWAPDDPVFVNWPELWAGEDHAEWLYENVFALGRGHAIYATHKQGKSLFVLWCCGQLATTRTDVDVIYLDYEMTRDDLRERLEDMGYGPDSDLTRLHYALLPSLPPLDTGEGAGALLDLVDTIHNPELQTFVVVDTTARAAQGDENSADTFREFYRWTGTPLKRRGITYVRLDHAGKDVLQGQRGSSAKGDDVDIIWRLTQQDEGGIKLHRDAARMSWVPETVAFGMTHDPLSFEAGAELWPAGTFELAKALDALDVPVDMSRRKARELMKEHGLHGENLVLGKALKYLRTTLRTTLEDWSPDRSADHTTENPVTRADHPPDHSGPPLRGDSGPVSVTSNGPPGPPVRQPSFTPLPSEPTNGGPTRPCTQCASGIATDISGLCGGCLANPGTLPPRNPKDDF
jgi:hypothetical protein